MVKPYRRENGTGTVVKLGGRRRRPYAARVCSGWKESSTQPGKMIPIYQCIGYFSTRNEGIIALCDYYREVHTPVEDKTLQEIYEYWLNNNKLSDKTVSMYKSAYKIVSPLANIPFKSVTASDVQNLCREIKTQTVCFLPALFRSLTLSARKLGINCSPIHDLFEFSKPEAQRVRTPFSEEEIDLLWQHIDDEQAKATLVYIYTGYRRLELFGLDKNNIDLENWTIKAGIKTKAGKNRIVPVHTRIRPLVQYFYDQGYANFISPISEENFYNKLRMYWFSLGMDHILHETRHTFETRLDNAGVPVVVRNKLSGHSNGNIGDDVYNHKTLDQLREAIECLK